jgi:predicted ATPase
MRSWSSSSVKSLVTAMKLSESTPGSSFKSDASVSYEAAHHRFAARVEKALQHEAVDENSGQESSQLSSKLLKLSGVPFVGREREMDDLNQALDGLLLLTREREHEEEGDSPLPPKVITITGAPGSGKSALAQQLQSRVQEVGGYFIRGKFGDTSGCSSSAACTNNGGEAYSGLAMAMEDFAEQIIERDREMSIRTRVREFLRGNENVLLDVVPALSDILYDNVDRETQNERNRDQDQPISKSDERQRKSSEEPRDYRSKRRVFFFQQFFHAVLSLKIYQNEAVDDRDQHVDSASENSTPQQKPCIVMVIDDLQWADEASLDLISSLVRDPDLGTFLLITTSRPIPEDEPNQLLSNQMERWRKERVSIKRCNVENLCLSSIDIIVGAVLDQGQSTMVYDNMEESATLSLAQIIHQRTQGNPFFAIEMLKALVDQQLLMFSYATVSWKWDNGMVYSLGLAMTDSPVDLLIAKAKRLTSTQQMILLISSCLGGTFKAPLIRKVLESLAPKDSNQTGTVLSLMKENTTTTTNVPVLETLETFVRLGILDRTGKSFFFVHDLIRQAAKEFVSPDEMVWLRLKVGESILRAMRSSSSSNQPSCRFKNEANLFLGVDLCNSALHLIGGNGCPKKNNLELLDLARYNLRAGEKAMRESAFLQAVRYLKTGIQCCPEKDTRQDDSILAHLVAAAAEASYCSGNYDEMNDYADQLLSINDCPEAMRLRMLFFKIKASTAQDLSPKAIDIGYDGLRSLGMATFPRYPNSCHVLIEMLKTKRALRNHTFETLHMLPIVTDPNRIAAMEFLNAMKIPASVSNPNLLYVTFLKSIRWAVKYGLGKHSPIGFAIYGTLLNCLFGDEVAPLWFGDLALSLADRVGDKETIAETSTLTFAMLRHWTSDMRTCYAPLLYAQKLAIECGDIETATLTLLLGSLVLWCTSMVSLPKLGRHLQRQCAMSRDFKHRSLLEALTTLGVQLRRLCSVGEQAECFDWLDDDESMAASNVDARPKAKGSDPTIDVLYDCLALQSHVLLEKRKEALECADRTRMVGTKLSVGQSWAPRTQFNRGLVYLARPPTGNGGVSWRHRQEAKRALSLLRKWVKSGNVNCIHMVHLLEAEFARLEKNQYKAMDLYAQAIHDAEVSGHIHDEGIGHECAARFFKESMRDTNKAAFHWEEAIRCFRVWGASAVVKRLEQRHEKLLCM